MKRKVDNRIRILIENGAALGHRTLAVIVGDKSRDQVVYLHHMLSKSTLKQASVLWCYKKELALSSHRKKRLKQIKAKASSGYSEIDEEDPFEMFVSLTDIRYCYYKETHKILGSTFKMCVLQDFEALTPNILCRTLETVEGGGVIVILLQSVTSLRQLYTMNMDVHARYRTEAHQYVVPRFNERFILSLASCETCVVMDDQLRILPVSSHLRDLEPVPSGINKQLSPEDIELKELKESMKDNPPVGILVGLCKTLDQAKGVLEFIAAITEKTLRTTVTLTAGRGRGKSAALGIGIAGAIAFGYSNIFVTSPSPENLNTLFEFVLKALNEMGYEEHFNYEVLRSAEKEYKKCILRVTVNRDHRQIIQYIAPGESKKLSQVELMVIDEAAAIPLSLVKELLGPYLVFLSSTVSGYEGTGRSLSLKLIEQLRKEAKNSVETGQDKKGSNPLGRILHEVSLEESIRYKRGDNVEIWLHKLLCLEAAPPVLPSPLPHPDKCQLYYVNRDTLFGYHKVSEMFLSQVMGLLVSSHYRNTPDDLQMLSDSPAHNLFVMVPPHDSCKDTIPPPICVVQVSLEGKISKTSVITAANQGEKPTGDLIPWTVSNLYQNYDFPQLSGARIVRIATHPHAQGKGYGSKALKLLEEYYSKMAYCADHLMSSLHEETQLKLVQDEEVVLLEEKLGPNQQASPLLASLDERSPEALHYFGVSYGVTSRLLSFWKRLGYTPVYLSQVTNGLTGEHTAIMLKVLNEDKAARSSSWLADLWFDNQKRLVYLLGVAFQKFDCKLALSLILNQTYKRKAENPSRVELEVYIKQKDVARLDKFSKHQCETGLITDILPTLAQLYFQNKIPDFKLKPVQAAILCGTGLQRKSLSKITEELGLEWSIVMNQLYQLISSMSQHINELFRKAQDQHVDEAETQGNNEENLKLQEESIQKKLQEEENRKRVTQILDVSQFDIKTKENEFSQASDSAKRKKISLLDKKEKKMKK
ncbi:RNA cytidine acetyltransferase-like isoform X2 [Oratosquilla oratoria]